jgi:hypothetical protein
MLVVGIQDPVSDSIVCPPAIDMSVLQKRNEDRTIAIKSRGSELLARNAVPLFVW